MGKAGGEGEIVLASDLIYWPQAYDGWFGRAFIGRLGRKNTALVIDAAKESICWPYVRELMDELPGKVTVFDRSLQAIGGRVEHASAH